MQSIRYKNKRLWYIDQTALPEKLVWRECVSLADGYRALKRLKVRGAPLIGVFAAYCICIHLEKLPGERERFFQGRDKAVGYLISCRPTAVNLAWALARLTAAAVTSSGNVTVIKRSIEREAAAIHREDTELCRKMASFGVKLIRPGDTVLTHCNSGFLATAGEGTALGVIIAAHKKYRHLKVYVDETRPLLQGARLTAWELCKEKVPSELICDSMAACLMRLGHIDKVFVGADRIAANGDVANKIGTYGVAVSARHHAIPFYVVAPSSTFDLSLKSGDGIKIEQRDPDEVKKILGKLAIAPSAIKAFNPAFDVTPADLVSAIVTDKGVIYPPFPKNISKALDKNSKRRKF